MRIKKNDINGVFRMFVGNGTIGKLNFELEVTTTPAGDIAGMPIVRFLNQDGTKDEVLFELKDLLKIAQDALESDEQNG